MINVAIFRMYEESLASAQSSIWLPAVNSFQLDKDVAGFEADFFRTLLQTLIRHASDIDRARVATIKLDEYNRWLNSPIFKTGNFGLGAGIFNGQAGFGRQPNAANAFEGSGLPQFVRQQLSNIFQNGDRGGIVCVLDNLEIVKTSEDARDGLDALRDRIFNIPEVRWVLCGARGVLSKARTPRLSGIFMAPEIVPRLTDEEVTAAIERRLEFFGSGDAKVPLSPQNFEFIYTVLNRNLRDAMSWAQSFSHWLLAEFPELNFPTDAQDMRILLERWLSSRAQDVFQQITGVRDRSWSYFTDICENGGVSNSEEHRKYRFGGRASQARAMEELVGANVAVREYDPDNAARELHTITATGYLLDFYRSSLNIPAGRILDISR